MTTGRRRNRAGWALGLALPALLLLASCTVTERQVRQEQEIGNLQDRIVRLERAVDELRRAPARAAETEPPEQAQRLAELGQRVEALDGQVRELLGRVDALENRPAPAPAAPSPEIPRLERRLADLAARVAALESRPAAPTPAPAPAPAPQARAPAPEPKVSARELYDRAYSLYKQGKYEDAREAFRRFAERYPKTDLTDNAYFWIGETYYDQQQYEKAILAYDKVVQGFPNGDKVPSALLKQAFAFDAIGDPVDARILLKKLLREHPSSEQAAIARKKLEMLGE